MRFTGAAVTERNRLHARIGSWRWVLSLAALTGTTALSIDMSLPAQPTLVRELSVSPEVAQRTLGLVMGSVGLIAAAVMLRARPAPPARRDPRSRRRPSANNFNPIH